jgi:hypothetical protein
MPTLKKGSAAAKAFMTKIRAAKGKSKPKAKKVGATKKAQYYVVDREAGNVIDIFNTYNTAVKEIMKFEKEDKANKEFVKDFYEIEVRDAKTKKVVNGIKKVMPTKKASSMHKDTKSHNVNIRVVSGIDAIDFYRVNNDINGNPRYVIHFFDILNSEERMTIPFAKLYEYALKKGSMDNVTVIIYYFD